MLIAFYKVGNSMDYERHEFDYIYDKPDEILKALGKLKDDEWRTYDLSEFSGTKKYADLCDLQEDYNDEILDNNGWWCVVIQNEKPEPREVKVMWERRRYEIAGACLASLMGGVAANLNGRVKVPNDTYVEWCIEAADKLINRLRYGKED